jgi:hypothetical protein
MCDMRLLRMPFGFIFMDDNFLIVYIVLFAYVCMYESLLREILQYSIAINL